MMGFFVFGCGKHIRELAKTCERVSGVTVGDSGQLGPEDEEFGTTCQVDFPGSKCQSDSFIYLEMGQ